MPTYDTPIFSESMVDMQTGVQRKTEHILTQNGWKFLQDGRYTAASPLSISSTTKTKLTFNMSQLAYQDGRLLDVEYNQSTNKFVLQDVGGVYLFNVRFKAKSSQQNSYADVVIESPSVSFNPLSASTVSFVRSANNEHFISVSFPIFLSQDVVVNGIEMYITPSGGTTQVYDYSVFIQKSFIPS